MKKRIYLENVVKIDIYWNIMRKAISNYLFLQDFYRIKVNLIWLFCIKMLKKREKSDCFAILQDLEQFMQSILFCDYICEMDLCLGVCLSVASDSAEEVEVILLCAHDRKGIAHRRFV